MTRFIIILFLVSFFGLQICSAQSHNEIAQMQRVLPVDIKSSKFRKLGIPDAEPGSLTNQTPERFFSLASGAKNEIQLIFSGLFIFYKFFISAQDASSCVFIPSCSEYGILAVKKQGVVIGIINTYDRLTRCNGMNYAKYQIDENTRLMLDPVRNIYGDEP